MNQDNLPIFEVELPQGDNRKAKLWFLRREEVKDGRECYSASMSIEEDEILEENFHCQPDKPYMENKLGPPKDLSQLPKFSPTVIPFPVFQPEKWAVDKNTIRNAIDALQAGLDHTRGALIEHDSSLGDFRFVFPINMSSRKSNNLLILIKNWES